MLQDQWKVVRLHRYKKADELSRHWWRWTASLATNCWLLAHPKDVIDIWRI